MLSPAYETNLLLPTLHAIHSSPIGSIFQKFPSCSVCLKFEIPSFFSPFRSFQNSKGAYKVMSKNTFFFFSSQSNERKTAHFSHRCLFGKKNYYRPPVPEFCGTSVFISRVCRPGLKEFAHLDDGVCQGFFWLDGFPYANLNLFCGKPGLCVRLPSWKGLEKEPSTAQNRRFAAHLASHMGSKPALSAAAWPLQLSCKLYANHLNASASFIWLIATVVLQVIEVWLDSVPCYVKQRQ